mmetsp:Transcript_18032/g.27895  ORF Transcript_18032/g.27895 Transcript_18032/m.27895 type:complete len:344 (-) Transcript_18032:244-1275(-)|eukprot:CAMPEP_0195286208 /NCGR_PEP_ID=MMETSP0707-20130614/3748_1 /TAXON_ID=33640 /ORGANISM="Asterionellopsis glacialis, Strain CCMP134" /LENGTH=343 /DNA_ID=CAMNT_0040345813 /DNA_START=129 /DNA_END=1160 /DNA_ORIENTATION=-
MTTKTTTTRQRRRLHFSGRRRPVEPPQNISSEEKMKKTDLPVCPVEDGDDEICDLLSPSTRSSIRQLSMQAQELMQSVRGASPASAPQAGGTSDPSLDSPSYPSTPKYGVVEHPEEKIIENSTENKNKLNQFFQDKSSPARNTINSSGEEDRPYDDTSRMMTKKKQIPQQTHEKEILKSITRVCNKNNNSQETHYLNDNKKPQQNVTPYYSSDDENGDHDNDDDSINEELNNLTSLEEQLRQDLSTHNMESMKRALRLISPPQPYRYAYHSSSSILKVNEQQERMMKQKQQQQQQLAQQAEQQLPFWWLILPLVIGFGMIRYMASVANHNDVGVTLEESVFWL